MLNLTFELADLLYLKFIGGFEKEIVIFLLVLSNTFVPKILYKPLFDCGNFRKIFN